LIINSKTDSDQVGGRIPVRGGTYLNTLQNLSEYVADVFPIHQQLVGTPLPNVLEYVGTRIGIGQQGLDTPLVHLWGIRQVPMGNTLKTYSDTMPDVFEQVTPRNKYQFRTYREPVSDLLRTGKRQV
jgi:hypothetical protein